MKPSIGRAVFIWECFVSALMVNVVLHFQSHYATAVACMKNRPTNFNVTAEIPCHVGSEIPVVPYYRPGSKELAQGVIDALKDHKFRPLAETWAGGVWQGLRPGF